MAVNSDKGGDHQENLKQNPGEITSTRNSKSIKILLNADKISPLGRKVSSSGQGRDKTNAARRNYNDRKF
jgi:hypothetical protein